MSVQLRRVCAFILDFVVFISVFTVLQTVFNLVYPGNYVPPKGMQLFTAREFKVFIITVVSALLLLMVYLKVSYRSQSGQTLGHRLFGIQMTDFQGKRLSGLAHLRVIFLATLRFLILFFPGPFIAIMGGSLAFSVFALLWGVLLVLPIPFRSRQERVTLWQHLGKYRFKLKDA